MRYQLAAHSLTGSRPSNQDRVGYAERDNAVLLVLADGLGGHEGGALAAETLTKSVVETFQNVRQRRIERPSIFLALAVLQAHRSIVLRGNMQHPPISPRTTCVLCLVQEGYAYWAHVGDSRLYHFRDGKLLARTHDHSVTEQLHLRGVLDEAEMRQHPQKAQLTKCVGGPHPPTVSLGPETALTQDDNLLLCSDGLWEAYTQDELAVYLDFSSLEEGVEEMLLDAERRMKQKCDNLSAVSLRWEQGRTDAPPLESGGAREVTEHTLVDEASHSIAREHQGAAKSEDLDSTLRDLEAEINRLSRRL